MFRVYKDFLRRLLMITLHYRALGYSSRHSVAHANDYWYRARKLPTNMDKELTQRIQSSLSFLDDGTINIDDESLESLIDMMTKQLLSNTKEHDRDLIDTIVRVIGLPYARNCISGSTLQLLRQAILLPDEAATFRLKAESERHCGACGHKFQQYEMGVFYAGNGNGTHTFVCTNCAHPTFLADRNDNSKSTPVSAIKGLAAALKRSPEPNASQEKVAAEIGDILSAANASIPAPARYRQQAGRIVFSGTDGTGVVMNAGGGWAAVDPNVPPPQIPFPAIEEDGQ